MHGIIHVQFANVTYLTGLTLVMSHAVQRQAVVTMHANTQLTLNVLQTLLLPAALQADLPCQPLLRAAAHLRLLQLPAVLLRHLQQVAVRQQQPQAALQDLQRLQPVLPVQMLLPSLVLALQ